METARERPKLPTHWTFWVILTIGVFSSVGGISVALLLMPPGLPNCPAIFWPIASASLRLYCAQVAANKQTIEDLLEAIALVNSLPANHPLRPEINRWVEQWSTQLLDLAEQVFQEGQLNRAIEVAQKIPANTRAHTEVSGQIERWRAIWRRAEVIYQGAEKALQQQNWRKAFSAAVRLRFVGNRYWETTQFEVLNQKIFAARKDELRIARARAIARSGGLTNLEAAMRLIQEIAPDSYFLKEAESVATDIARKLLDLAAAKLAGQDLQGAIAIAQQIPRITNLWEEAQDFITLADAQSWTWSGNVPSLEEAIVRARQLGSNRPLHLRAQELIARWELEIIALNKLNQAHSLAESGSIKGLMAAIAQAGQISPSNPRWPEVRGEISKWTQQIQTLEDQPTLDRADQYASVGDRASLNSAIITARRIRLGRPLYEEAQNRIQDWTWQLHPEVEAITWDQPKNTDSQSQQRMRSARQLASQGTPRSLASAIKTANQVDELSSLRVEADQAIDRWSQQILNIARKRAKSDPAGAIAIAQQVPTFTGAYTDAQFQIQTWRESN